jgi:hypothetical protein
MKATRQMAQAQVVLAQAHKIMHQHAAEISLDSLRASSPKAPRQMFFTNLPWNRGILAIAEMVALSPNISRL